MSEERLGLTFEAWDEYTADFEMPISSFVALLIATLEEVPKELHHTAVFGVHGYDDQPVSLSIRYTRPETDEELAERKRLRAIRDQNNEDSERRQYERLREKFGGKAWAEGKS